MLLGASPTVQSMATLAACGLLVGTLFLIAWWIGLLRRPVDALPRRIDDSSDAVLIWLIGGTMFLLLFLVPMVVLRVFAGLGAQETPPKLSDQQALLLQTAIYAVGIGAALVMHGLSGRKLLAKIGLRRSGLPRSLLPAGIAILFAVPATLLTNMGAATVRELFHMTQPAAHELLQMMSRSQDPGRRLTVIATAVLFAPVFEEILFRGHLQTALAAALPRWAAIFASAIAFTVIHDPWSWPALFLLAVVLGYAYERTNNLYVPILIHAAFNSTSTTLYLILSRMQAGGGA